MPVLWEKIKVYAYRRLSDMEQAQDVASEVFLRMYKQGQIEIKHSWTAWAMRVAHNIVIDIYRERSRKRHVGFEDSVLSGMCTQHLKMVDQVEKEEFRDQLFDLSFFSDQQKQVVFLYMQGMSFTEIGSEMDMTLGAVKATLHRARVKLKHAANCLQEDEKQGLDAPFESMMINSMRSS